VPLTQVAFLALLVVALTAAFSRGERTEHVGGALLLAASLATAVVQTSMFQQFELGIAAVDALLLVALIWLAFAQDRRWPIFAAAFQSLALLTHIARLKTGDVHGDNYALFLVLWSYLVMASLLWGALVEAKAGAASPDANLSRPPDTPAPAVFAGQSARDRPDAGQLVHTSAPRPAAGRRAGDKPPAETVREREPLPRSGASDEDRLLLTQLLTLHGLDPNQASSTAGQLLSRFGNFAAVTSMPSNRLKAMGHSDQVVAALAFARSTTRTSLKRRLETRIKIDRVEDVLDYLHAELAHLPQEQFRLLYLNARNRLILDEVHGTGTVDAAPVYPREVIKRALETGAVGLILAHNHPSGDPGPSREDILMTKAIIDAGRRVGVNVVDHLVLAESGHVSMRKAGLI
jgi:DNA repair protein RadC